MGSLRSLRNMQTDNMIEEINNNPLQFTCPVCGCHELVLVETHIVYYTIVQTDESGELQYQPTPICIENDGNREDCYFACAGYHPDSNSSCNFVPNHPDYDPYNDPGDDPDNRISDDYAMLQWIKNHQRRSLLNNIKNSGGQVPQGRTENWVTYDHGADINAADSNGQTPLMVAVRFEEFDIAKLLIERGADATLINHDGKRSLDLVRRGKGSAALRKLLEPIS